MISEIQELRIRGCLVCEKESLELAHRDGRDLLISMSRAYRESLTLEVGFSPFSVI